MVAGRLLTARVMWLAVAASAISRAAGTRVLADHSDENVSLESMWSFAAVGPVNCVPGGSNCAPGGQMPIMWQAYMPVSGYHGQLHQYEDTFTV